MKVLMVDDEPDILEQAKIFLEKEDKLNVETATSVEEGLGMLDKEEYDTIVSDYQMPIQSGLEFLKIIRKELESDIPFLMFTGKGREEVAIEALNLGADRYIQKGGDPRSQYGVLAQAIVQEIKHKKVRWEKEKIESELSSLVKGSKDPIYIIDKNYRFVFANDVELSRHDIKHEEIIGTKFHELHEEKDSREFEKKVRKTLESGKSQTQEIKHRTNGEYYIIRTITPIENPITGETDRVSVISKDITEQEESKKALEYLVKSTVGTIGQELFVKTVKELARFFNADGAYIGEIKDGKKVKSIAMVLDGEKIKDFEYELPKTPCENVTKEGACIYQENICSQFPEDEELKDLGAEGYAGIPIKNTEDRTVGVLWVISKDRLRKPRSWKKALTISASRVGAEIERMNMEKELKKSEREKSIILNNISEIIAYHDINQRIVWANEPYGKAVGEDPEDLEGQKCYEIWRKLDESCKGCPVEKAIKTKKSKEAELTTPDDKTWKIRGDPVKNKKDEVIGVVEHAVDITEQKRAQEKIEELSRFRKSIIENSNVWIDVFDKEGNALVFNKAAEEISGYSRDEVLGSKRLWELFYPDEEYRENILEKVQKVVSGEETMEGLETTIRRKDGQKRTISWNSHALKDEDGNIIGFVSLGRDITEEKKMEEREDFLHSLLRHDLKNKIQIIGGYHELLKDFDLPEEAKGFIRKAQKASKEGNELIEKVRTLREIGGSRVSKFNIHTVIGNVICEHETQAKEDGIKIEYENLDCEILGGPLLEELFSNLLENSIKHANCKKIKISAEKSGEKCVIIVEDDGKGISNQIKDKIFEKGFKCGKNAGSGLGLALVKEIAESYGGNIKVEDSELGGAKFKVKLQRFQN